MKSFTPTGRLRAAINLGNPMLAKRDPVSGELVGVSVDLAREFANRLGAELELVVFDAARKSVDAMKNEQADIGFFAIDPLRGQEIAFTPPYVLIEGSYLVHAASPLQRNEEVDQAGLRVVVGAGSAYDLYLSRTLKAAHIVRAANSATVLKTFLAQNLEVAAGVRQQLQADLQLVCGLRLLPGRFMVIEQALGTPRSRGPRLAAKLSAFVDDMKTSGIVAAALKRHGIKGATVAP